MFGLINFRGSCWVNACIQALFRIPEVQQRYSAKVVDKENVIDESLCRIWNTKGQDGLRELFEAVKTDTMPAGEDIGDAHELFQYLCDKLPFLDKLCRFKLADSITCNSCNKKQIREDSVIEYPIESTQTRMTISECILNSVQSIEIEDWKCDDCKQKGCKKQQLIGSFPDVLMFHRVTPNNIPIDYSSILVLNKRKYALLSVSCYNGAHWWGYGRDMPPGTAWYELNDQHVIEHSAKEFPVSPTMRFLIYYRLEN